MRAARVLVGSAIAHVAVFVMLAQVRLETHRTEPHERVRDVVAIEEHAVMEVIVLPPEPHAPTATRPQAARATVAATTALALASATESVAATGTESVIASGTGSETATGTGSEPGPDGNAAPGQGIDLSLRPETAERIASGGRPLPAPPKISGRLKNTPGGGAVVDDAVTTMTMERDGNVSLRDKPDFEAKPTLPLLPGINLETLRKDTGRVLSEWFKDPYAGTRFGPMSMVSRVWLAVPGACTSWGDVWCDDELAPQQEKNEREFRRMGRGGGVSGKADITSWLHRKLIGDPYSSRKLKLLDDTRDERVARGGAFRAEQLKRSAEIVLRTLEQLWANEPDPAKRKQALFELWDDCAEGEDARGEAGERARAMIVGWIRTHVPQGGPGAYTADEIATLDRQRTSKQSFAPYAAD